MKRAKIMLFAIVAFAAVGGALAFKAKSLNIFYSKDSVGNCVIPFNSFSTTTVVGGGVFDPTVTTRQGNPCGAWVKFNP